MYFKGNGPEVFFGKGLPTNFVIFTGNSLCWNLFSIKLRSSGTFRYIQDPSPTSFESLFCVISSMRMSAEVQKQPFRGVLIKVCSKNMQQIYRRTPMLKYDLNKFARYLYRGVLLCICCIFSEHLFIRTPLKGYFWKLFMKTILL